MRTLGWIFLGIVCFFLLVGMWGMVAYNAFQTRDEKVSAAQTNILNVYKKRADLIPNLAATVSRYAEHEKDVLLSVAAARARAGQITLPPNPSAEDMKKFEQAQKELSSSLARLLAVAESNPNLKANENFLDLQKQLAQIETQAVIARRRYIEEVKAYNVNVRSFPNNLIANRFGYTVKPQLSLGDERELRRVPKVFDKQ